MYSNNKEELIKTYEKYAYSFKLSKRGSENKIEIKKNKEELAKYLPLFTFTYNKYISFKLKAI